MYIVCSHFHGANLLSPIESSLLIIHNIALHIILLLPDLCLIWRYWLHKVWNLVPEPVPWYMYHGIIGTMVFGTWYTMVHVPWYNRYRGILGRGIPW